MKTIKNKISKNKQIKLDNLFDAAERLFAQKGINNTVIDDIVKEAGVAKGTFYLYFKNKYDIIERLTVRKSMRILTNAQLSLDDATNNRELPFDELIIQYIDFVIENLKEDKKTLRLIYKNLSWGFFKKVITKDDSEYSEDVRAILNVFIQHFEDVGIDEKEAIIMLFMMIELTGSICYSSIILEEPYAIDEMKPYLFNNIRKMLVV